MPNKSISMKMQATRALGFWETYCALLHDINQGIGNTAMHLHVQGELNPVIFTRALHLFFLRHPMMRMTCSQDASGKYFFYENAAFEAVPITYKTLTATESYLPYFE